MEVYTLWKQNIEMQYLCKTIIQYVHRQNYYAAMIGITQVIEKLPRCIEMAIHDGLLDDQQQTLFVDTLQNLLSAQEAEDYILLADLLELQLLQDLQSLQEKLSSRQEIGQDNWAMNRAELMKQNLDLAHLLEQEEEKQSVWVENTSSGLLTMASEDKKGKYYFHSNVNPLFEAYELANWYYKPEKKKYLIYGFGLGYHIEELIKIDESIEITVIEPDIQVLKYALSYRDVHTVLGRIRLVYDPEFSQLAKMLSDEIVICIHYPSMRHIESSSIREKMEQIFIRDSGIKNQHNLMVSNFRENTMRCKRNVDELKPLFTGKKAVIVAAGPSLDKNINHLKQSTDDTLIISTGTAFHRLLELGIRVDYVIVTDAQPWIKYQFRDNLDRKIPILLMATASKSVAAEYQGEAYIIYQKDYDLSEEAAKRLDTNCYETGGSVATTALDVCIRLGCSSVAYIGLDLAYTNAQGHATGTSGAESMDISGMQLVPGYEYEMVDGQKKIVNVQVATSHLFTMYRNWITRRSQKQDVNIEIYDASEGGSIVDGLKIITLEEYLKL